LPLLQVEQQFSGFAVRDQRRGMGRHGWGDLGQGGWQCRACGGSMTSARSALSGLEFQSQPGRMGPVVHVDCSG
jgi:hypothetical protein